MPEITLGVNNAFALKNWPEPIVWARIIAQELGLDHVQFSFDLLDPTLPDLVTRRLCDQVTQAVARYHLSLDSTFTGLIVYAQNHLAHPDAGVRARAFEWYQGALQLTARLSAAGTGGHVGAMSATDYADSPRRAQLQVAVIESVRDLARSAASLGLQYFLWELMRSPREFPHTPDEATALMHALEGTEIPVQLCFDLGHCSAIADGLADPYAWLEQLLPWTRVVHLQQTDGKADRHWPFIPHYEPTGIINPSRVVEIVKNSPLDRVDLVFEIGHAFDASDEEILDDHKRSVEAWSQWL